MSRSRPRRARRFFGGLVTMSLMAASGLLTLFIFASSYEIAFNQDLPVSQSLAQANIRPVEPLIPATALTTDPAKQRGNYGAPVTLRLAAQHTKLPVAPAIKNQGAWEARSNTAHSVFLTTSRGSNMGDLLLYVRQGWRTIPEPGALAVDGNLFVDTDKGWRYMYRITSVSRLGAADRYLLPDNPKGQLVVVLTDAKTNTLTIARAELVTLQSIEQ